MTNAGVQQVIATAAVHGRVVSEYQAEVFLGAKEILATDASNQNACTVVRNFLAYLETGVKVCSFAEFLLPLPETDEEIAGHNRRANESVATQEARR